MWSAHGRDCYSEKCVKEIDVGLTFFPLTAKFQGKSYLSLVTVS